MGVLPVTMLFLTKWLVPEPNTSEPIDLLMTLARGLIIGLYGLTCIKLHERYGRPLQRDVAVGNKTQTI